MSAGAIQTSTVQACNCIGPQNGQPLCPCAMRNVEMREGRWVRREADLGPVMSPLSSALPASSDKRHGRSTMSALLELAERCEAASGPDREIDGWIWAHLRAGEPYVIGSKPGRFPQDPIYGERADVMRDIGGKDAAEYIGAPAFTASLDAAMTLLPEAEAGYSATFWRVGNDGEGGDPAAFKADVLVCAMLTSQRFASVASTPALALCAAALRALSAQEGKNNG
jgi:hypothetical protein